MSPELSGECLIPYEVKPIAPPMHISNEFPMIQGIATLKHNICTDADSQPP